MIVFLNIPINIKGDNTQGMDYVMWERPKHPMHDSQIHSSSLPPHTRYTTSRKSHRFISAYTADKTGSTEAIKIAT